MTDMNGQSGVNGDDDDVSSDEDFYFRPTLNGESALGEERRRLVTSNDVDSNAVAM